MSAKAICPGFWLVFWRECRWLAQRPLLLFLATIIPISVFCLLASVYFSGTTSDLPIAVLDMDNTSSSRQVIRLVDATPDVRVTTKVSNLKEGRNGILAGKYYGLLFIPKHFTRDGMAGRRPEISYFYNTQMMSVGNLSAKGISAALPAISGQVQTSLRIASGMTSKQAAGAIQPIPLQTHGLFNPLLDYSQFVLAALVIVVLQLTTSLATCYSVSLDVEPPHQLRILRRLGGGIIPAVLGKLLPLTIIACLVHIICDIVMFGYFGLPLRGSGLLIAVSALIFVLSCQFLATIIALFIKTTPAALSLLGVLISPSFGYLGVSFPREAMDAFPKHWGNFFPGTPYVSLRIDQTVRGTPVELSSHLVQHQLIYLTVVGLILYLILLNMKRHTDAKRAETVNRAIGS